ncbi:G1 family glutamic endopeptidase [Actinacidiphila sp. ITFR-21]|uniref:G1 family glutamic endopeptidase n=1 Tax=Actinacidiphila sp. ITFR-21 TaxID=3075199 RepID=UPI002889BCA3|nr:G1 family glutamic endopeptidase [Streptomyces sp. ITFR-21]WNI14430.1 G1 family glutamic endopeptidase [Streptomyces sp. ITFR-21]
MAAALLSSLAATPGAAATAGHIRLAPLARHRVISPDGRITHSTSSNWAGYAATGATFTSVSASWVQPSVTCTSSTAYSSFWIGLDGDGSNSVEQTGSEADCSGGRAQYYSWYEMYPAYPVNYSNAVSAGDHFTATVSVSGTTYTLTLSDTTQGWTKTTTKRQSGLADASAEVIAEAPSSSSGVLPLAHFSTASFSNATANGQAIGNYGPDKINMASGSTTKATTSALSGGTAFSVTWNHS